ncbi:MAG: sulfite oxidase heme-binding subunit YedZ [Bordetella sp.]|uniref:sulfite oxidase heme-binding subunit YedZ n=1 Tax=Bordetella sp. TaxID=28081 RepID=UPI003F7C8A98
MVELTQTLPVRRKLDVRTVGRIKPWLFVVGLVPFLRWIWLGFHDGLTVNPVEFLTRSSGTWTLVCLLVTLGITPLRRLINQPALVRVRRMCGLFTFFYAFMHFLTWAWWDRGWDPSSMIEDVGQRPFILVGFTAFVLLCLLAITSPQAVMRAMGRNWQRLHRAIYVIGALAILHFWWMRAGKNNFEAPVIYGCVLIALLGWRVVERLRK